MRTNTVSACFLEPKKADLVRTYLQEIRRFPLLTHEQELIYGKQVQQMMRLYETKAALAQKLGREPTLERWAQATHLSLNELDATLMQGHRAKRKMIEANLRLVVSVAKKYQKRGMELLDLVQEGSLGLERGVEKFDPTKGYKFSTYAYWWCRQGITRAIAQQARMIRLPVHVNEKLNKIKKAQRQLAQKLGRTATVAEIADALDWSAHKVQECLQQARQPISLELRVGEARDTELGELIVDNRALPENYAEQSDQRAYLEAMMAELTSQQQQALTLRFGLNGEAEHTLTKAGECMGVSRERVRQLEASALKRLRMQQEKLSSY
ncbi:Cyanobacteria-specific RpoD-like sigma factor, type-2 @ Group 2 RNA polymerase sigma factor [uncultured Leptolyngbya sp.]|uniref:Cyanobacteria-specific RpoD-like sigma factor, type-2 @ Group 2 RNA polymerase sigma factor n=1 Tax=uncultured Leptolyngbya sp. TaxID=332963 RepID=A0A6J4MU35_9CYAN|nr:Cyanobacteria-specific RpoD-like sigma factor, type-2 @ Group 2 RNA polymerase sigma factor [uncultured Leptolyngbya sp.]